MNKYLNNAFKHQVINPIATNQLYQAIDRQLMLVDELPSGALCRYERDVSVGRVRIKKPDYL